VKTTNQWPSRSALALANYLATVIPADGDYDAYMVDACARWPDLTNGEINWAVKRASDISESDAKRLEREAAALNLFTSNNGDST
jgi:hypothetical protein